MPQEIEFIGSEISSLGHVLITLFHLLLQLGTWDSYHYFASGHLVFGSSLISIEFEEMQDKEDRNKDEQSRYIEHDRPDIKRDKRGSTQKIYVNKRPWTSQTEEPRESSPTLINDHTALGDVFGL